VGECSLQNLAGELVEHLNGIADLQFAPARTCVVINKDAKSRTLPLDGPFAILELRHRLFRLRGGSVRIALDGQTAGRFRREIKLRTISQARDSNRRVDLVSRCHDISW